MTVFHVADDDKVVPVARLFRAHGNSGHHMELAGLAEGQSYSAAALVATRPRRAQPPTGYGLRTRTFCFTRNCLDTLADLLQGRDDGLVHPEIGLGTRLLEDDDEILEKGRQGPNVLEIPIEEFEPYGGPRKESERTAPDYARRHCTGLRLLRFNCVLPKAGRALDEDLRRPRVSLADWHAWHTAADTQMFARSRHIVKGRYAKKDSLLTRVRKRIRQTFTP